jgi:predicted ATPase
MDFIRGSEWRRWDLHVHTPFTLKNDCFAGANADEKWQNFFDTILSYVGNMTDPQKAVCAIGITDYFSVENYKKVIANNSVTSKIPLILPNVELRLLPAPAQSALNLHCIFNPVLTPEEIEDRFLSKLSFSKNDQEYSATASSLVRLGKAIGNNNSFGEYEATQVAINQFVVSIDQVKDIFNNDKNLRNDTIIVIPNSQNDGASGIGNQSLSNACSNLTTFRQELYKFADVVFSGNPNDTLYFLGKGSSSVEQVKQNYGKLMPCIHGSDAHENSRVFEPEQNRYCWIKADCTFNGLKQIKYEPETRVQIGEIRPEEKKPYYVIDQVTISNDAFPSIPIKFNENLTCIIGGKSTGKSVLLNNIAVAIDSIQVDNKSIIVWGKNYRTTSYPLPEMEVKWKDGTVSTKASVSNRKIVYIPQTYLNRLADESTEKNDIDKIIEEVLLQSPNIKAANDACRKKIADTKAYIDKKIYDIIFNRNKETEIRAEIAERGIIKSIENEIKRLRQKKQDLSKQASISDEEIQTYEDAVSNNKKNESKIQTINKFQNFLTNTTSLLEKITLDPFLDDSFSQQIQQEMDAEYLVASKTWEDFKIAKNKEFNIQIKELQDKIAENNKNIVAVQQKMADTEVVKKLNSEIESEEKKKTEIETYIKQKEILDKQYKIDLEDLITRSISFENIYTEYASKVNNETGLANTNGEALKFIADSVFRGDFFLNEFSRIFDNRKLRFKFEENPTLSNDYDANRRSEWANLSFIEGAASVLKKAISIEDALRIIFSDFFTINYTVSVDNDTIKEMSPGKKAVVLLKLLINLAESNCPILIDQPEDDLDNRSIYYDLASFIRNKKSTRQIILVTHNANIVLGCDAEEIIVANQHGTNSQNDKFRFDYRSGAIENIEPQRDGNGNIMHGILNTKGIQDHICEILEGGKEAFNIRKNKYSI